MVFGNETYGFGFITANALRLPIGGTTLTIGEGITVRGQNGFVGYSGYYVGPQNVSVVKSKRTISAEVAGGIISINAQPFSNQGVVESAAGTLLLAGSLSTEDLGIFQSGTGPLALSGVLTNAAQNTFGVEQRHQCSHLYNKEQKGTIHGGAITISNGAGLVVNSGTLDGVTVNGNWDVGNTVSGANLMVTNGLTINGTLRVGNP